MSERDAGQLPDFYEEEDCAGLRFSWNAFPVTRTEEERLTFPIGAILTPLGPRVEISEAPIVSCSCCKAVLSSVTPVDCAAGHWSCALCQARNHLPFGYEFQSSPQLEPGFSSLEYVLPGGLSNSAPVLLLYVIDLSLDPLELRSLTEKISEMIPLHPLGSAVGLVTFDSNVKVFELGSSLITKMQVFRGAKIYDNSTIQRLLEIHNNSTKVFNQYENANGTLSRYFVQITDETGRTRLQRILTQLHSVSSTNASRRPERCTGQALKIASNLMNGAFKDASGHVMLFIGGPCTTGEGQVVDIEKSKPIRSFHDIDKSNVPYLSKAVAFYTDLTKNATRSGKSENSSIFSFNIFSSSYDQTGLYEMKIMTKHTGGALILNDSFTTNLFKETYTKFFDLDQENQVDLHSGGTLEILTSASLEVAGVVGGVTRIPVSAQNIADTAVGEGFTNKWYLPSITSRHNYAVYFKVKTVGYSSERKSIPNAMKIQFITTYRHSDGTWRKRVTTVSKPTTNSSKLEDTFDQEAAVVLLMRKVLHKIDKGSLDGKKVTKYLNDLLVHFGKKFAIYIKDEPSSFHLLPLFSLIPQFLYNAKKSPILTNFNCTPDESSYYVDIFNKANTTDSLLIIQPTLTSYSATEDESVPVLLDASSLKKETVLLMDSFFHVVIHVGEVAATWRDSGLDKEEFANVYEMLEAPIRDAYDILSTRFPLPRYILTDEGQSQDRFLLSRLNPSHNDEKVDLHHSGIQEVFYTEDMTLNQFYRELQKIVVKNAY